MKSSGSATIPDAVSRPARRTRKYFASLSSPAVTTRTSDLAGGFPEDSRTAFLLSGAGAATFPGPSVFSFPGRLSRCPDLVRVAFPGREAPGPGGGPGRLPGAGGQAVRALAVTARA